MANVDNEKASDSGSYPQVAKHGRRDDVAYALDERRRAALRDVDEAEFSYVLQIYPSTP
jgi:MFS transporter, PHS family, inorganic phosphate transporter